MVACFGKRVSSRYSSKKGRVMDERHRIATNEFICLLKDRGWHDLYEFHEKYRLAPALVFDVVEYLLAIKAVIKLGTKVRLSENLPNAILAILNRAQKTNRPSSLDVKNWR